MKKYKIEFGNSGTEVEADWYDDLGYATAFYRGYDAKENEEGYTHNQWVARGSQGQWNPRYIKEEVARFNSDALLMIKRIA